MSATETFAAVLVAHGDRGGPSPNAALHAQAEAVGALIAPDRIFPGLLKGEPALENALADAAAFGARRIVVYPLFMADGYFMRKVRERVSAPGLAADTVILAPLGLDEKLPDLIVEDAMAGAQARAFDPLKSRLLIVGHGSKLGPASANATRKVAARAALTRRFASFTTAFLEEEPFLEDTLHRGAAEPTVIAGFFFGNGMHAGEDVPDAIQDTGANAIYTGAIGNRPAVAPLIAAAISESAARTA